jgi:hypothetical protein
VILAFGEISTKANRESFDSVQNYKAILRFAGFEFEGKMGW